MAPMAPASQYVELNSTMAAPFVMHLVKSHVQHPLRLTGAQECALHSEFVRCCTPLMGCLTQMANAPLETTGRCCPDKHNQPPAKPFSTMHVARCTHQNSTRVNVLLRQPAQELWSAMQRTACSCSHEVSTSATVYTIDIYPSTTCV